MRRSAGHLLLLHCVLFSVSRSLASTLNRAVAVSKVQGPASALALIEPLAERLGGYFHFHGVQGAFLTQLGRADEARVAFNRAIALANTAAEAAHIRRHLDQLVSDKGEGVRANVGMEPARTSSGNTAD